MKTRPSNVRRFGLAILTCSLCAAALGGSTGRATQYMPVTLDIQLIRSDAVLFGTISEITPLEEDDRLVRVSLTDVRYVGGRWDVSESRFQFNAAARLRWSLGIRPRRHEEELLPGHRYLLFLEGGEWHDAPLLHGAISMWEVVDDVVRCAGGEVFGVQAFGLLCSTAEHQAAPPLRESELATLLARRIDLARERRPADALALDLAPRSLHERPGEP